MVCNSEVTRQTPITASNTDDAVSLFHLFLECCTRYFFFFSFPFLAFTLSPAFFEPLWLFMFISNLLCVHSIYCPVLFFFFSTFYLLTLRSLYNVSCPLSFVAPISLYSLVFCYFDVACVRNSRISPECITRIVDNQKKSEKSRLIRFTCVILFERFISVKFNHFNFLQNWWYPLRFSNMR